MTSKISFSKLVRSEMHQMSWMTAVWGLVFGLLIPFRALLVMAVTTAREGRAEHVLESFSRQVGLGHWENTVLILCAGALCALCAFSYLHSPVKLDFYHSLALRKERLFAARYLGSVLTFAMAYTACQLLAVLVGVFYGAMSPRLLYELALATVQGILYFLCSYAGVLLAILLTGKLLTTLFAVGVFGLYIPLLYFLWFAMQAVFLETRVGSFYEPQFGILRCSSPWAFCLFRPMDDAAAGLTGAVPPIADFCQLLAMAALFTAASLLLYRIRRTEAAGSALAFKRIEGAVKLLLTVPTAVLAALLAYELLESVLWELIFMALFGALGCMIMEFIFRGDIRQVLHRKKHILLTVLLAAALFFPLRFDLAGYNTYLPAREEVAAMAVKDFHFQMHYPEVSEEYRQQNTQERKMLDYLETDRVDVLYPLAAEGVKNAENITGEGPLVPINLKYRLTNGKEVYRFYYVNQDVFYRCMEELMADPDYRETYFPLLTWTAEDMDTWRVEAELYPKEKRPADEAEIPEDADEAENADGAENPDEAEDANGAEDANEAENAGETEIPEDSDEDYGVEFSGIETASDDSGKQVVIEVDKSERERLLAVYQKELRNASWKELWEAGSWMYVILDQVNWQMEMYPLPDSFRGTQQLLQEIYEADGAIGRAG